MARATRRVLSASRGSGRRLAGVAAGSRLLVPAIALVLGGCAPGRPGATPAITPGTPGAPRDVNIIARDYTFDPPIVDLVPGETVAFHVIDAGLEVHEIVVGDGRVQAAWEAAEAATAGAPPGPTPTVSVAPDVAGLRVVVRSGERIDARWTVPSSAGGAGESGLLVGCHIPGHFARGMQVPVRLVGPGGVPLPTP
jgi:uncharacterized cupredoxin-like copper-binding protein